MGSGRHNTTYSHIIYGFYGTLLPIDFVDGLAGAELEDILIPGKDTESDDSLRERYFNSYDNQAFGGNQSDYKERVSALADVGGVKVFRAPSGYGTVELTIVDSEWSVPSSTMIYATGLKGDVWRMCGY